MVFIVSKANTEVLGWLTGFSSTFPRLRSG